jgi:hypothetical protein
VPFLVFRPGTSLIEDDVRSETIKQGILHQVFIAKTQAIIRNGRLSSLLNYVDSLSRPTSIDKPTDDIIKTGNTPSIKFMYETRSNLLYTREKLHKRDPETTPSPACPHCQVTKPTETVHHALTACPVHVNNNAKTIYKIADLLLNIPDPIADTWQTRPSPLPKMQAWLDINWPSQLSLTEQKITPIVENLFPPTPSRKIYS